MRILKSVSALLLAASCVNAQFHFNAQDFKNFMDSGNGTELFGNETFPELTAKFALRVVQLAEDWIAHPDHLIHWMDGDKHAEQNSVISPNTANFGASRAILEKEQEKTIEHYFQSVQESLAKQLPFMNFASGAAASQPSGTSAADSWKPAGFDPYPFFGFIPLYVGSVVPGGAPVTFSGPCFEENVATATSSTDSEGNLLIDVEITVSAPTSLTCTDRYLMATLEGVMFQSYFFHGTHKFQWKLPKGANEDYVYDVMNKGIRINRFFHDPVQLIFDVYETAQLFVQALTNPLPSEATDGRNLYFLKEYARIPPEMKARTIKDVEIDESLVQNGDFFGIVRLDGLDPMLAWAMGSTTGHTTIALRDPYENDRLYIAESTTKDAYWPVNGMQRTPFQQWLKYARAAGYNVVHAPLAPKYREKFNATKALEWFRTVEGLDYGYHTMLWAWIDTLNDNYPCVPPEFKDCLVWDHMEVVFGWMDLLVPSIADLLFTEAFNFRLGTKDVRAPGLFRRAQELGYTHGELPGIIEDDSWLYHTTRFGKPAIGESHVCCTFVCKMWKVSGIFDEIGAELNCNEFTNWDAYALNIFDSDRTHDKRPQQCIDADPSNALCQLTGDYTLELNNFNTKPMQKHMAEKCASKSPVYVRDPAC